MRILQKGQPGESAGIVLTCIRQHVTLDDAGDMLRPNDEYRFRTPDEMTALLASVPAAITNTRIIAERCASAVTLLPNGAQVLPAFPTPDGSAASAYLRRLCVAALRDRYVDRARALAQLEHERRAWSMEGKNCCTSPLRQ